MKEGTLGILLTTGPEHANTGTAVNLSRAARGLGKQVEIFVMYEGIYNIRRKDFIGLADEGIKITACAVNADESGLPRETRVHYGSQYDLAVLAQEAERFLSFTR